MADTQILKSAVHAAPSEFVVPDGVEFELKAVRALYTDNGAGSSWLPALVITSDASHTVSRAVDQAVVVSAGSDAEVSFFRGVKHARAAAAGLTGIQAVELFAGPVTNTIVSGVVTPLYPTFQDASGVSAANPAMQVNALAPGFEVQALLSGFYLFTFQISWIAFTGERYAQVQFLNAAHAVVSGADNVWRVSADDTPAGDVLTVSGMVQLAPLFPNAPQIARLSVWQGSGVNQTVNIGPSPPATCAFNIGYLPIGA